VNNLAVSVNTRHLIYTRYMGNTEGTSKPEDSVETTREASTEEILTTSGTSCPYCGVLAVSSTEALLNKAFRKLCISFKTQQVIEARGIYRYQADLLISQKPVVVEADDRYHQIQRGRRELDQIRDSNLITAGYEVYHFTEEDIGTDANACAWYVVEQAGLKPEVTPVFDIRKPQSGPYSATWDGGKPAWACATCGRHFHSYRRGGQKPCITCSRECQAIWQAETGASVNGRRSNGEKMRRLWDDPAWRAKQTALIISKRWPQ
jgi:very-short-patch-repair endonuclease